MCAHTTLPPPPHTHHTHTTIPRRSAPPDPLDWQPALADRLSSRIAQLAATNAIDMSFTTPWAVEVAERAPEVGREGLGGVMGGWVGGWFVSCVDTVVAVQYNSVRQGQRQEDLVTVCVRGLVWILASEDRFCSNHIS